MAKSILGWVRQRWTMELEPVLRTATVVQEAELRALWERELAWWKSNRGIDGDSLRNPLTNVRTLIKELPLTEENSYENEHGVPEHIGLAVFNLAEGEWVSLNDRQRAQTQKRLEQEVFITEPDTIVQRALPLLLSEEWAELVVGVAICTGRRLTEVLKTGEFTPGTGYSVWFEGQLKASNRPPERFEIPTLLRAFLVLDAVKKVRHLVDCTALENDQVSQKYGNAVNETVDRIYRDLIPIRVTKEQENAGPTAHVLRGVYAHIAVLWFDPRPVDPISYMAQIQGHGFLSKPKMKEGATEEEVRVVQQSYASHANYADYQIVGPDGHVDGRRGIKLGQPGVTVLAFYEQVWKQWLASQDTPLEPSVKRKKRRAKSAEENKTGFSPLHSQVATREWVDELREQTQGLLKRPEIKDDEMVRRMAAAYAMHLAGQQGAVPDLALSLEQLNITPEQRTLLSEGMALSGAADLLTFLLTAGEREASLLRTQVRKHDTQRYLTVKTSDLANIKLPEAAQERIRRAVYAIMSFNEQMAQQERKNDLWYITPLLIQNLVGGRKEAINSYLDAHREEIDLHHAQLQIVRSFNRKAQSPKEAIPVPDKPQDYPWGKPVEASQGS
jgi:hypothetical protein